MNDEDIISVMDFDDFDRRFELKTSDTSEEVQAKRESGKQSMIYSVTPTLCSTIFHSFFNLI